MDINAIAAWWNEHGVAVVAAIVAFAIAAEGLARAGEEVCLVLLKLAAKTKTTKDDEALKGAAKWLQKAAVAINKLAGAIRPFSVKGR